MKRIYSIKKNNAILNVLKKGEKLYRDSFSFYFLIKKKNDNFHYACSVSKKLGKSKENNKVLRAPTRNYYKRVIAHIIYDLDKRRLINKNLDFFIICKQEIIGKSFKDIYSDLEKAFILLNRKYF